MPSARPVARLVAMSAVLRMGGSGLVGGDGDEVGPALAGVPYRADDASVGVTSQQLQLTDTGVGNQVGSLVELPDKDPLPAAPTGLPQRVTPQVAALTTGHQINRAHLARRGRRSNPLLGDQLTHRLRRRPGTINTAHHMVDPTTRTPDHQINPAPVTQRRVRPRRPTIPVTQTRPVRLPTTGTVIPTFHQRPVTSPHRNRDQRVPVNRHDRRSKRRVEIRKRQMPVTPTLSNLTPIHHLTVSTTSDHMIKTSRGHRRVRTRGQIPTPVHPVTPRTIITPVLRPQAPTTPREHSHRPIRISHPRHRQIDWLDPAAAVSARIVYLAV